jgi:hypothetical protein
LEGLEGDYIAICDVCGREIDHERPGNVENPQGPGGAVVPVFFVHKECSSALKEQNEKQGKPRLLWRDLESIRILTQ